MGIEATEDTEAANSGFEGTIEAANKAADGHRKLATKEEVMELDLTFHIELQKDIWVNDFDNFLDNHNNFFGNSCVYIRL